MMIEQLFFKRRKLNAGGKYEQAEKVQEEINKRIDPIFLKPIQL